MAFSFRDLRLKVCMWFSFSPFPLYYTSWSRPSNVWWGVQIIKVPFIPVLCFGMYILLLLFITLKLLWQFRHLCHPSCFAILLSLPSPYDFFILRQLKRCLPFSFLQSNIILIISSIYTGFWHCPWHLSDFEIFECGPDPFLRCRCTVGTSGVPYSSSLPVSP